MAKNKGRVGAVRARSQLKNPITGTWTKRDDKSGKFMDVKADPKPFKGVRRAARASDGQTIAPGKKTQPEREYIIHCDVTLCGAAMFVKARSPQEALAKAKRWAFEDIVYKDAELKDWNITSDPKENR
jgi:hypothetical protein